MVAVGKTAWHHHLASSQPLSCQWCEYGLRLHVLWVPPHPCGRVWVCRGGGTEVFFITSMQEWDQRPDVPVPLAKSTLGGDTVLARAARGLWTCRVPLQAGKKLWKSTNRCVRFNTAHTYIIDQSFLNLPWLGKIAVWKR